MNGIDKEVDRLGRVVIPVEYRKRLGIKEGTRVVFSLGSNSLTVRPEKDCCALCGATIDCACSVRLCAHCIEKVRADDSYRKKDVRMNKSVF